MKSYSISCRALANFFDCSDSDFAYIHTLTSIYPIAPPAPFVVLESPGLLFESEREIMDTSGFKVVIEHAGQEPAGHGLAPSRIEPITTAHA